MNKKKARVLSFIGGCVFFSVVVGVLLFKNEALRKDAEEQLRGALNVSRELVRQAQYAVGKLGSITGAPEIAKESSNIGAAEGISPQDAYDALWRSAEAGSEAHVKSLLPR
jgi:hypothetical protein